MITSVGMLPWICVHDSCAVSECDSKSSSVQRAIMSSSIDSGILRQTAAHGEAERRPSTPYIDLR